MAAVNILNRALASQNRAHVALRARTVAPEDRFTSEVKAAISATARGGVKMTRFGR
jgi:hypothetical protein